MCISVNNTKINLLENGNIKSITRDNVQFNLFQGNEIDTPIMNVYVSQDGVRNPLISKEYIKEVQKFDNAVKYLIDYNGINITITYSLNENEVLNVCLQSDEELVFTHTFDIGCGDIGFLDDKEAYASQYIDSKVFDLDSFSIAMRRTLGQSSGYPQIEVLTKNKVTSYATEGYDFYPLTYKNDGIITDAALKSRDKHYEMAFTAFEFEKTSSFDVYVKLKMDNQEAISGSIFTQEDFFKATLTEMKESLSPNKNVLGIINGNKVNLSDYYSNMHLIEQEGEDILSFFTDESTHVVSPIKENLIQRMHGNIITTGNSYDLAKDILVSSNYINGVFSAQNAVGNVGQNTLNSNIHSNLDIQKLYGQRIYIKDGSEYKLLNAPSFYEMGLNFSKWVYKLDDNEICVTVYTDVSDASLTLTVNATNKIDFVVLDSYRDVFEMNAIDFGLEFKFKDNTFQNNFLPDLTYYVNYSSATLDCDNEVVGFNLENYYSLVYNGVDKVVIQTSSSKAGSAKFEVKDFMTSMKEYNDYICEFTNNIKIELDGNEDINMFNHLIKWYTHNALIHFATPHGLEQHAGSAWGTRDVCQGPLELFIAFGKFDVAKKVLLEIFKNQSLKDGSWPQWFMFDEYKTIRADDYHGDIIAWPIKIMADYINMSGDKSILDEKVAYYDWDKHDFTTEEYSILDHLNKEVQYIENNFIKGTHLSSYGHGDWDDTLQPANKKLRENMVSGWTVPLTYQGYMALSKALIGYDDKLSENFAAKAELIKEDYKKYLIKDDVVAGFAYLEDLDNVKLMLHPTDLDTNIKYRLLPINRSIISGLFNEEEINNHLAIVNDHLKCPDGVRLMDNPAPYNGGTMTYFQRGESASTVGREISLQYVHAHIRYIESMLKLGRGAEAFEGFLTVNPFNIQKHVPNAQKRQANAYFSSSEGDFDNRYTYAENFNKLKTGDVAVKGGWRIYSSGPGIYLNQLIGNFLGLKYVDGKLYIDPVVSEELKGMKLNFNFKGYDFEINYLLDGETSLNGHVIKDFSDDVYRTGGFVIDETKLENKNKIIIG